MAEPKMKILDKTFKYPWIPAKFVNATHQRGEQCFIRYTIDGDSIMKTTLSIPISPRGIIVIP